MTTDQLIAMVGQAATWVTVVVVFLTLREMGRQRKQSLQPELVIPRVLLHGALDNDYFPTDWSTESSNQDESVKLKRRYPNVTIYNLGVGSATNIDLRWDFHPAATLQTANQLCQKHSIPILFKIVNLGGTGKLRNDSRQIFQLISTKGPIKQSISLENDTPPSENDRRCDDQQRCQAMD